MPAEPGRYELPWTGNPAEARTLNTLRLDLERAARGGRLTDQDHPLLRELDGVAASLVASADQLHRARWGLGLVQPDNVMIRERNGRYEAVLVDLGFTWRGTFGAPPWDDSPGRPDWIDANEPWTWLWDAPPARQQFADPDNGVFPPHDPVADLRTLGRLLAWLISGQTSKILPVVGGPDGPPPTWSVVADAASGRVGSAEALAARLRANPLSEYFVPLPLVGPPREPPTKRWILLPAVLLGIVLLGGGLAALKYFNRDKQKEVVAGQDDGPRPTKKDDDPKPPSPNGERGPDLVSQFDIALKQKNLPDLFAALKRLLKSPPRGPVVEVDNRRKLAVDEWIEAYNGVVESANDPGRRFEAAEQLTRLETELKQLTEAHPATDPAQREKEQQCLDLISARIAEFDSPR